MSTVNATFTAANTRSSLEDCLAELLQPPTTLWVAYSGGLDSHVLLHTLVNSEISQQYSLQVVHINHQLHPQANAWTRHCEQVCTQYRVPLEIIKVNAQAAANESPEAAARQARYAAFAKLLQANDVIVTAHQQDDQAETLLLQLLRGAGVAGLAAMPVVAPFAQGYLARPLLAFSRADIHKYALAQQLTWLEDDSNQSLQFDRNFLRHNIMPLLAERWPGVTKTLSRVASHCATAANMLAKCGAEDLLRVSVINEKNPQQSLLSISKLLTLSLQHRANVIRYWLQQLALPLPSTTIMDQIQQTLLQSREDATPLVSWPGAQLRRYRDALYAMPPLTEHDPSLELAWDGLQPLSLPNDLGELDPALLDVIDIPSNAQISVRFRQGGEICQPKGRQHTHELKKLFQEWGVPPWQRDRVPLVYIDGKLRIIVGHCACNSA